MRDIEMTFLAPKVNLGPLFISFKPLRVNLGPLEVILSLAPQHVAPE